MIPFRRNSLHSSQQLLAKQTIALKKTIDFRRLEHRIADVTLNLSLDDRAKAQHYDAFMRLLEASESDLAQLKVQCINTQQVMAYIGQRHDFPVQRVNHALKTCANQLNEALESLKQQFIKNYGPGFFRKSGALSAQRFEEWAIELANLYQNGHSSLNQWHRLVTENLSASKTRPEAATDPC
jgi:hypothetical protein